MSPSGNKWILTAVCPYSNFLQAIPVPDKTATTAADALLNDVFFSTGFPSVLQSDRGGEWLNALLHRITKLLSINPISTGGGVLHVNFVCLFITFLVLGRLPPNLVTFLKIITLEGHGRKFNFCPWIFPGTPFSGEGIGREFLVNIFFKILIAIKSL